MPWFTLLWTLSSVGHRTHWNSSHGNHMDQGPNRRPQEDPSSTQTWQRFSGRTWIRCLSCYLTKYRPSWRQGWVWQAERDEPAGHEQCTSACCTSKEHVSLAFPSFYSINVVCQSWRHSSGVECLKFWIPALVFLKSDVVAMSIIPLLRRQREQDLEFRFSGQSACCSNVITWIQISRTQGKARHNSAHL